MIGGGSTSISVAAQGSSGVQDLFVLLPGSEFFFDPTFDVVVDKLVGETTPKRHDDVIDFNRS